MSSKTHQTLKQIAVSKENYLILKGLGGAGDSFNDVVTEVLKKVAQMEKAGRVGVKI